MKDCYYLLNNLIVSKKIQSVKCNILFILILTPFKKFIRHLKKVSKVLQYAILFTILKKLYYNFGDLICGYSLVKDKSYDF